MALQLFLDDSYLKEFEAKIASVAPHSEPGKLKLALDRTAFYATSGGQPCDLGKITNKKNGNSYDVIDVRKENGETMHAIMCTDASEFAPNDAVSCSIDWERRHRLMRTHSAGHILSTVMYEKGIQITGNQLGVAESRFDFNMENFDRALIDACMADANSRIAQNKPVSISYLPREDALREPGMSKLAGALPPAITVLRIIDIEGIDRQADGGTHVKNTAEIGKIMLTRAENKGKSNRRIYFQIVP